jgi:4-amino-4-deoxy-L-arabinose transferase-like glycosyltransferase
MRERVLRFVNTAGNSLKRIEASALPDRFWLLLLWVLLVFPMITLRGPHLEEGTVLGLARGALDGGHWIVPHQYDLRWVERPALLSSFIAALSWPFGSVHLTLARLPVILSLLAGGLMVHALVRRYASRAAALAAASFWFISPMILQKLVTVEPDVVLTVVLFAAYVVWWNGHARGGPTATRWLAIALLLAIAGFIKGPQPLGFFITGIGAFLLIHRAWRELAAFAIAVAAAMALLLAWYVAVAQPNDAALWLAHSRLGASAGVTRALSHAVKFALTFVVETFPGSLLIPFAWFFSRREPADVRAQLLQALLLYAGCCTLLLVFWPGAATRHAMPAVPAIAAAAGLAFDRVRNERPSLFAASLGLAGLFAFYAMLLNLVVMPLVPSLFQVFRTNAAVIETIIKTKPLPVYFDATTLNNNLLVEVRPRLHHMLFDEMQKLQGPAWLIIDEAQLQRLSGPSQTETLVMAALPTDERLFQRNEFSYLVLRRPACLDNCAAPR